MYVHRYAQVGDATLDHSFWGRPEEMTMSRPVSFIDETHPGSDLAGEVAAAMAAASQVFLTTDAAYSNLLVQHAKSLYTFATQFQGKYSESIQGTAGPSPYYDSFVSVTASVCCAPC